MSTTPAQPSPTMSGLFDIRPGQVRVVIQNNTSPAKE